MKDAYEITRAGSDGVELVVSAHDADDALNVFADYMERRDVPAFWQQDAAGVNHIDAAGDRYYARPAVSA